MSGDTRTFPPINVPTLTLVSAPGGSFNSSIATSLTANAAQTAAYSLILPSALPSSANQALLSDTSGNLSWGTVASSSSSSSSSSTSTSASYGTFAATAPQATAANVTGLIATNPLTAVNLIVSVNATTKLYVVYSMQMYQKGSSTSWGLTYSSLTDTDDSDVGLVFTITSAGQVQYTSPSYTGWVSTTLNWYASYTVASTLTSQVTNTYSGASNVTTATSITGLLIPTGVSQMTVNVFVIVKATTNLSGMSELKIYLNAASSGYVVVANNVGDNTGLIWSITTAGQIQYTSPTYSGFTSMTLSWTTPFTIATTATTLSSLALTAGFTVGTNTILAQSANSGSVVSTNGSLVHLTGSTFTDASTAASSTASGTFNGMYLAAPTLAATNTAVTNSLASTLTIAGAPLAGTNTTLTNAYALNVVSGISQFAGTIIANGAFTAKVITATSLALSSTLNVTGLATHTTMSGLSLTLANAVATGTPSSTVGQFFNVQAQTYTDSGTAASSTAAGTFSASYLGIPTLTATNTGVTTATASTLTIAGAPLAGTNETLTNLYALNVASGNAYFGGKVFNTQLSQGYGNYTYNTTNANVTMTAAQMINGFFVSNNGSNGSYNLYTPTAAALFAACGNINGATFTCSIYPDWTVTLSAGSGGVIWGGTYGNSASASNATTFQTSQGGSSLLLPNSKTYLINTIILSSSSYVMFLT